MALTVGGREWERGLGFCLLDRRVIAILLVIFYFMSRRGFVYSDKIANDGNAKAEGGRSGDPQTGGRVFAKRRHSKYSTFDTDNHHDSADDSHGP